ncbi:unnamed protein product, partial [Mesorhabditis belari]|uniref:Uncharacterized protein n=1 Tax=Mesorhabditis belari TaxID=2138241 RepID=A0AAF3EXN1_9BILA
MGCHEENCCFLLAVTLIYAVIQIHLFVFFLIPYSNSLPNETETLLNHAIPYNTGGLLQMEQRFGCTFDLDIYKIQRRRQNPLNTCDPDIESSFIPMWLLISLGVLRLIPVILFVILISKRTPLSEFVAQFVERFRPTNLTEKKRLYVKKQHYRQSTYQSQQDFAKTKTTTFGATNAVTECMRPPPPSPGIDHSISYNNAAYFAREGAYGGPNSTRSSEISRIDAIDLNRASHHNSGTIMSDV